MVLELSHPPSKKKNTGSFGAKIGREGKENAREGGKKE